MLSRLMAATARHRRLIVSLALLAAICLVVFDAGRPLFPGPIAVVLIGAALAILAFNQRPAALDPEPDLSAFGTRANPGPVFLFGAYVPLAGSSIRTSLEAIVDREDLWQLDLVILVLYVMALGLLGRAAWISPGLQLRRDGVLDRSVAGSLFVPWEAFAPDQPAFPARKSDQVAFSYARPDLVRRRGLPRGHEVRTVTGVDVWFLSRVIHHYVTHPEFRAAIGTEAEYRRLRQSLEVTPGQR